MTWGQPELLRKKPVSKRKRREGGRREEKREGRREGGDKNLEWCSKVKCLPCLEESPGFGALCCNTLKTSELAWELRICR